MRHSSFESLPKQRLLDALDSALARERGGLAESLVCLAIVEERRLYATEHYPTMFEFCLGRLHMSEGAVYKRLRAARAARRYPVVLDAIADGRLHLSAVVELAPCLTPENVAELVQAATHNTREGVRELLAERFPRPDVPFALRPLQEPAVQEPLSPGTVDSGCATEVAPATEPHADGESGEVHSRDAALTVGAPQPAIEVVPLAVSPRRVTPAAAPAPSWRLRPLSPGRYELQATLEKETVELLRRAKGLLMHAMPGANELEVLQRVLRDWVLAKERQKYGLTDRPRTRRTQPRGRFIPAAIKRAVAKRDGCQCTFVDETGARCGATEDLEYDHITPVARGGETTVANLRLRCRTHNQLEADRAFGERFMRHKREHSRQRTAAT